MDSGGVSVCQGQGQGQNQCHAHLIAPPRPAPLREKLWWMRTSFALRDAMRRDD